MMELHFSIWKEATAFSVVMWPEGACVLSVLIDEKKSLIKAWRHTYTHANKLSVAAAAFIFLTLFIFNANITRLISFLLTSCKRDTAQAFLHEFLSTSHFSQNFLYSHWNMGFSLPLSGLTI